MKTLELANGMFVSMAVAEVTSVPFFELFSKDLDRANYMDQVLFTQILQSIHRKSEIENTSFEFLFQSIAENIEPSPENIQDILENIDYNQAFEGLDSYDFDGINYSDNPERLDASLDSFQSDTWENLSIDEQKDAMNGLAEYVEEVIGFENPPEIVYYNNPVDGDYGGYSAATNTLEVNEHMISAY